MKKFVNKITTRTKHALALVLVLVSCNWCPRAAAETMPSIVRSIEYRYEGNEPGVNHEIIESRVQLKVGQEFSVLLSDSSVKALYASGMFDNVSIKVDEISGSNDCKVVFTLTPRAQIQSIDFTGNKGIESKSLRKKLSSKPGMSMAHGILKSDVGALTKFYNDKGYPYAEVSYYIDNAPELGEVKIVFVVCEGEKLRVGKITFPGNDVVKKSELLEAMRTRKWTLLSFFRKLGVYRPDDFAADIDALKIVFKNHGYLDVEINATDVTYTRRKNVLDICIPVTPGQKYYIGNVSIKGNKLYTADQIKAVMAVKPDDVFSLAKVDASIDGIMNLYGKDGCVNTGVHTDRRANLESNKIDLEFEIDESDRCFVNEVEIRGNSKTKNKVILRELTLAPGDPFDIVRMKISRARLLNTGCFSYVDVSPIDTPVPERKDLLVEVKEADTGKFGSGGGISTGGEIVGFVEFSQRNFDIHSENKKFQGAGQKFRSYLQVGKHSIFVDLNFEEPWLFDRELAVGTNLYFHKTNYDNKFRDYSGAHYNEDRIGGEVYARKNIYELWDARLSYKLENVKIYNISRGAPQCFFDEEGNNLISKVTLSLERDTRDNLIYPTTGSKIGIDTEFAGGPLFGSTKYIKFSTSAVKHWLVSDTAEQVFSVIGRTGTIMPYCGDTTPFFDRFYLGGSNFMKGFKAHDIGPKEGDTGVGGNTFAYGSTEYCIKLAEPLRIYFFAEVGFVNETQWNFSTKRYNTDAGVGLKISIMGMPLRLDFGFPIHGEGDNKHGMRFNYSFGVAF
ncbi:MAG: outer membrane protein assembly factor BamA [Puniceicoccales bacterium]|nr:outer membrane protein assembly factor BamA [Puniceicoccales bacterium]